MIRPGWPCAACEVCRTREGGRGSVDGQGGLQVEDDQDDREERTF